MRSRAVWGLPVPHGCAGCSGHVLALIWRQRPWRYLVEGIRRHGRRTSSRRLVSKDPGLLPQTSSELLAHESAHLLFPHGGPPDFDEWRAAIDADRPNHYGYRYVDDAIECYAVDQHDREDWANAVAMLHESVRDDEAHLDELRVGSQGFRDSYPNRARIIDRLLAASSEGATSPTVEH
jgi:hypothetical protein